MIGSLERIGYPLWSPAENDAPMLSVEAIALSGGLCPSREGNEKNAPPLATQTPNLPNGWQSGFSVPFSQVAATQALAQRNRPNTHRNGASALRINAGKEVRRMQTLRDSTRAVIRIEHAQDVFVQAIEDGNVSQKEVKHIARAIKQALVAANVADAATALGVNVIRGGVDGDRFIETLADYRRLKKAMDSDPLDAA